MLLCMPMQSESLYKISILDMTVDHSYIRESELKNFGPKSLSNTHNIDERNQDWCHFRNKAPNVLIFSEEANKLSINLTSYY